MKRFQVTVNGVAYDVQVEEMAAGAAMPTAAPAPVAAPADAQTISAPMPGTIVNVPVNVGDKVSKGQVLVVMEAMKMENEIMAPNDGTVVSVMVKKGDSVNSGSPMVVLQ